MTPVEPLKKAMGRNTAVEHQGDADQSAGDLAHRAAGRLLGRELVLLHHALDVFHDHDRIVHQQADREHHAEHGQRVDRVAGGGQYAEGAQEHHRHGDRRDQSGAEILQEQIHHQEHQHNRFEQRLHHLVDGNAHERGRVIRVNELQTRGKERCQLVHGGAYRAGGLERVRARGQLDGEARGRIPVVLGVDGVAFGAQTDASHVLEPHLRAVRIDFEQHAAELIGVGEALRADDGGVQALTLHRGEPAQLTDRDLQVLVLQRVVDVNRRQPIVIELGRVQPNAHGVLGTEQLIVADPGCAADRILNIGGDVVADVLAAE